MSDIMDTIDLARTAPVERRPWAEDMRRSIRERLTKNADGECVCDKCAKVIPEPETICIPCDDEERQQHEIKSRLVALRRMWKTSAGWDNTMSAPVAVLPRWDWARFSNEEFRKAVSARFLKAAEKWHPSMGNLVLSGDTGLGKTSIIVAKVHDTFDRAYDTAKTGEKDTAWSFAFVSALDLIAARRTHKLGREEPVIIDKALTTSSVLILDEVGFEDLRDQLILEIADSRYRLKRTTIVTTGRRPEEFAARYGASTWRRFSEGGHVIEDFRKAAP